MTIVRIGATKKYTNNWGLAFGQKPQAKGKAVAKKAAPASPKKASMKKPASAKSKSPVMRLQPRSTGD